MHRARVAHGARLKVKARAVLNVFKVSIPADPAVDLERSTVAPVAAHVVETVTAVTPFRDAVPLHGRCCRA